MAPWLIWLLPVPLATLGAIAWTTWSSRTRGPEQALDSVQAYDRFRAAMSTPVPSTHPPARGGDKRRDKRPV